MVRQPVITNEIVKSINAWKREIQLKQTYLPFITVRKVNKVGRRHWVYCVRQNREVHLLSDGEERSYKILLWQPNTISVEEQYVLDIDETLDIAIGLNVIHPRDWKTFVAHPMTLDFLVKVRLPNGGFKLIAYSFKYWNQIFEITPEGEVVEKSSRTWQKFCIEREYWARRGVEYRIITERNTTKQRAWCVNYFELAHDLVASRNELVEFGEAFIESWISDPRAELQDHLNSVGSNLRLSFQRSQSLFQYCGLHHLLPIVTTRHIRLFRPVELKL
ncbi:TnsA endonuclease N-terminal domain-containing protein [Aliagarivorans taiwanensis]|uniref:TnsA endonuclease N-terminal domain-containing protein n=1 Tax=Aliagarivorans taiwanensis TaxID=561966 RepID=UPI0003F5791E|nr:TnsA endonuclease N-terminal domain-containing protein [Aliagarivorans taiwanensis]